MSGLEVPTQVAVPKKKIPLKARISFFHQHVMLRLRYLFRLPIDTVRERRRQAIDRQVAETLQNMAAIMNQMNARLHWYETRVPFIAKEYRAFVHLQNKRIEQARQAQFDEFVKSGMPEEEARAKVWPKEAEPKRVLTLDELTPDERAGVIQVASAPGRLAG